MAKYDELMKEGGEVRVRGLADHVQCFPQDPSSGYPWLWQQAGRAAVHRVVQAMQSACSAHIFTGNVSVVGWITIG